jgi:hypothetical protein
MRVQGFVFNWPRKKQHAAILEKLFKQHCETTVVNSYDSVRLRHPHWQHIGNAPPVTRNSAVTATRRPYGSRGAEK